MSWRLVLLATALSMAGCPERDPRVFGDGVEADARPGGGREDGGRPGDDEDGGRPDGDRDAGRPNGGDVDAGTRTDAGRPVEGAAWLGQPCAADLPCPDAYQCVLTDPGATRGFCTLPCMGAGDDFTCSDGFPGPGEGRCIFQIPDASGMLVFVCGVICGTQWMPPLPEDCPGVLTCMDLIGSSGGTPDGLTDVCL